MPKTIEELVRRRRPLHGDFRNGLKSFQNGGAHVENSVKGLEGNYALFLNGAHQRPNGGEPLKLVFSEQALMSIGKEGLIEATESVKNARRRMKER